MAILGMLFGLTLLAVAGAMIHVGFTGLSFDLLDQFAIVLCLASGLGLLWAGFLSWRENRLDRRLHRRRIEPG